jgi:succinate dehydrogenase / fumarate reductase cytochrome b subunit
VKDNRPTNLDLFTVRFPLPALTSITHRISGVVIFAGVFVLLWLLAESLSSASGFATVQQWLSSAPVKLVVWAIVAGLLYHLFAGIKHLIMDLGYAETLEGTNTASILVIVASAITIILTGVWIW